MCSNNVSVLLNKENLQPCVSNEVSSSATPQKLSPATRHCDFIFYKDDGDSYSDDIFKVRKIRAEAVPVVKIENLSLNEKLYCDLEKIYKNGVERSIEEIKYDKWLKWKKRKAEKRLIAEMADEIDSLKSKIELDRLTNKQEIKALQDQLANAMELIRVKQQVIEDKQVVEDKQEVSTMIRDLINGSYNDTQIDKTLLKPVSSIPVKDFTIYKDDAVEEQTLVAPNQLADPASQQAQDNVALINFDTTYCIKEPNFDFLVSTDRHDPIDMEIEKAEHKLSQLKASLGETKRKSFATLRETNKLSVIAENSRDSTNVTEKNSPVKMCPPVSCKSIRSDFDLADLSVNPIIHRGSMNFRFSEAFTMHIPNSEDECVPKSCSTPGKTSTTSTSSIQN